MTLAYKIHHLTKIYPKQTVAANNDVSLEIEAGEIFGLFGANGAGKSTLIKQMVNLLRPTSGAITLFGKRLNHEALYTTGQVGYMPQGGLALNALTVGEALYFTANLRGFSRQDARIERDRLLEEWDLVAMRDRIAQRLSGGQRRLVLVATTVAASPPVLILDEPTNDLDPQHRHMVWENLRRINRNAGATIVLVTHNVVEAERVVQRVGMMQDGCLVAVGRPGVLKAHINDQLRLEMVFPPQHLPSLPVDAAPVEVLPGRWQLLIDRGRAAEYIGLLSVDPAIEDFRLSTATLEDLYLDLTEVHHANSARPTA